nr:hypothetical protein [Caldimonas sp.]
MRLARTLVAIAAFAAAAVLVPSVGHARGAGAWHGGGWHGGHWHGGWHGGYYRPCCYGGYWPFWGGVAIGASIGYWGGYWGGYYPAYYYPAAYGPAYSYYYDAPPGGATYSEDTARGADGQPAPQAVQPAPQASRGRPVPQAGSAPEPIFYPRNGQSAEQTETDRRDCNRWATTQRGAMADASIFQRATFACMEGRGYTVR